MTLNNKDIQYVGLDDTSQATGLQLKRLNSSGVIENIDITGATLELVVEQEDGTDVTISSSSVSITTAASGLISIDWDTDVTGTAGTYYYWVKVTLSGQVETFPPDGKKRKLIVASSPA